MFHAMIRSFFNSMINRDHKQDSSVQTQTAVPAEVGAHKHGCICTMCGVCEYWAGEKGPFHPDSYVPMPQLLTSRGGSWSGKDCPLLREYPDSIADIY